MDALAMLDEIMRVLESVGARVQVRNLDMGDMPARSGLVHVRGEPVVYLHNKLDREERIEVLIGVLKKFDLADVFISPALRERLEGR